MVAVAILVAVPSGWTLWATGAAYVGAGVVLRLALRLVAIRYGTRARRERARTGAPM